MSNKWTEEDKQRLILMRNNGKSNFQISKKLNRTIGSVVNMMGILLNLKAPQNGKIFGSSERRNMALLAIKVNALGGHKDGPVKKLKNLGFIPHARLPVGAGISTVYSD
jgi:hypothetical protein